MCAEQTTKIQSPRLIDETQYKQPVLLTLDECCANAFPNSIVAIVRRRVDHFILIATGLRMVKSEGIHSHYKSLHTSQGNLNCPMTNFALFLNLQMVIS